MIQIGEIVDGFCSRCGHNVNMNVAALDGETILTATCRTCHNTVKHKPERSEEQAKTEAWKKLTRLRKRKVVQRAPEVVNRRKRVKADSDKHQAAAKPDKPATPSKSSPLAGASTRSAGTPWGTPRKQVELEGVAETHSDDPKALWRELTATLGPRDGIPYYADRVYQKGEVMLHKRHGMGVVESVLHENACMVLFRSAREVVEMGQPAA